MKCLCDKMEIVAIVYQPEYANICDSFATIYNLLWRFIKMSMSAICIVIELYIISHLPITNNWQVAHASALCPCDNMDVITLLAAILFSNGPIITQC